jgi:hypothetical protein
MTVIKEKIHAEREKGNHDRVCKRGKDKQKHRLRKKPQTPKVLTGLCDNRKGRFLGTSLS